MRVGTGSLTLAIGFAALLSACGDDGGPSASTSISQAQAQILGEEAAGQVGALASSIATFGVSSGSVGGEFLLRAPVSRLMQVAGKSAHPALRSALARLTGPEDCQPDVSDDTDTDADGIPDNAVLTFDCQFVDDDTGYPVAVTGGVSFQDTDGGTTLFGYTIGFDDFSLLATIPSQSGDQLLEFQFDGNTGVDVRSGVASAFEAITWRTRLNGDRILLVANDWDVSYTPESGTIDPGASTAPAGAFAVDGNFTWNGDFDGAGGNWGFSLDTTAPLEYNGTCDHERWPFDSGVVRGRINANQDVGFTVDYQGCGEVPTVTIFGIAS